MKKIMLGVLVLIPILIMLIVGLVTSFVSTQAYIGVESVSIEEDYVTILFSEVPSDANGRKIIDLDDYMTVTVLPERAANKTLEWRIEGDVEGATEEIPGAELVREYNGDYVPVDTNTDGIAELTGYCTFRVSASAEGFSDSVIVEVTDADVDSITLTGESSLVTGERTMLSPVYTPAGSIVTQGRWASSNESVATVDGNGVVTAVGEGSAVITMSAHRDKEAEEAPEGADDSAFWVESAGFTVTVGKGVSLFGNVIYTTSSAVTLADAGIEGAEAVSGCTVTDGVLSFADGAASAVVSVGGVEVGFVLCGEDDFAIRNADLFSYDPDAETPFTLGIGEIPLDLDAVPLDSFASGEVEVTWSSSDEEVAVVDENGVVTALSEGETTVSAEYAGVTRSLNIRVVKKVSIFRLAVDQSSLAVGLARETIFASYRFDPEADLSDPAAYDSGMEHFVDNVFAVEAVLPTPPESEEEKADFYADFIFKTDKPEIASFNGNTLVFHAENITERTEVTVTVSPRYPRSATVGSQSITLTVHPAVEVNDVNEFFVAARATQYYTKYRGDVADGSNVILYQDRTPAYDGDIVLGSDIPYCDMETGESLVSVFEEVRAELEDPTYKAELCCSLYGNGHNIYASRTFIINGFKNEYGDNYDHPLVEVREENGVVSNVTITPNYDIGDEITSANDAQGLKGYALRMRTLGQKTKYATHDPAQEFVNDSPTVCRVEYSILQNASSGLGLDGVDCTLDGIIVRNTGGTGIYVATNIDTGWDLNFDDTKGDVKYSIVRMHNVTMSNMIGTGGNLEFKRFTTDLGAGQNPDDPAGRTYYQIALDNGWYSKLYQTGFIDIYNWQPVDNLSLLDPTTIGNVGGVLTLAMDMLRASMETPEFSYLVKKYAGISYVHFGLVSTGFNEKSFADLNFTDDRFSELTTEMIKSLDDALTGIGKSPIRVFCYTAAETAIQPGTTYTINSMFIDRLHAE